MKFSKLHKNFIKTSSRIHKTFFQNPPTIHLGLGNCHTSLKWSSSTHVSQVRLRYSGTSTLQLHLSSLQARTSGTLYQIHEQETNPRTLVNKPSKPRISIFLSSFQLPLTLTSEVSTKNLLQDPQLPPHSSLYISSSIPRPRPRCSECGDKLGPQHIVAVLRVHLI